jgi:predicted ATPase
VIASVSFRNFKALRNTDLTLAPFNLLIGPNGSGKTSLIEAIMRLKTLARLLPPTEEIIPNRPNAPEIVFHFGPPYAAIEARLGCVSESVCDAIQVMGQRAEQWESVRAELMRARNFQWDHAAIVTSTTLAMGRELAADGGNLAAVLANRQKENPRLFERIQDEFTRLFPEFLRIDFLVTEPSMSVQLLGVLKQGGQSVAADSLSQGTLAMLAFIALSFDEHPPSIVCFEEIDRGLHPRMLREMRDLLYRLSYPSAMGETRTPVQVVVTTQSPYLLDLFRDHPEEVVISQKGGGEARFERLADRADLAELLKEGSLGDMWFAGILGGVPEDS